MLNENMTFTCSSVHGYAYTIGIDDANGNRIDTYDTTGNTYTRSFSTPGKYSCYITTYNGYGYADSERIYFTILPSPGDLNFDNTLTTADAVLLQRYLLQERTLTQSQWQTADLNADGTVNGFDLALLRQKLVG